MYMENILTSLIFLININQETLLNFFGIENSNNLLNISSIDGIESTSILNNFSFETIKLIFQELLQHYQNGLGLVDIENIMVFIVFIRFIILAYKYNIKTSFYINCISLFAAGLWYFHIKDLINYYEDILMWNRFTSQISKDITLEIEQERISNIKDYTVLGKNDGILNYLKNIIINGSIRDGHSIDPISMLFTQIPESVKSSTDKFYWKMFGYIIPTTWRFFTNQIVEFSPIIIYLIIVRLNKRYCPYFIRWHWTLLMMVSIFEMMILFFIQRLQLFIGLELVPQQRWAEEEILFLLMLITIILHFFFILFGLLHAICGQYFYIPFLVENTEIHIGLKPKNSIYSGGYTAWQTKQNQERIKKFQFYLPKLWWGWFGKGTAPDKLINKSKKPYSSKKFKKRIFKFFEKLLKFIINFKNYI